MTETLPFFVILLAGVVSSTVFSRLHLPWVIALLTAGVVVGPNGLNLLTITPALEFIGEIGLVFLMFMAGLETRLSSFREFGKSIITTSALVVAISFLTGFFVGSVFGYSEKTSILLGVIFISSSIAVVIPSMEDLKMLKNKLGKTIIATAVVADVMSLTLLSVFLQTSQPITSIPLPIFYLTFLVILIGLRLVIPRIRELLQKWGSHTFEREVRVIFVILLGTVLLFEVLGLHPITAGFFAGLILSESIKSDEIKDKLHVLSYGIFIPVFFVIVGTKVDLRVFGNSSAFLLTVVLITGSLVAKIISGYLGGVVNGFNKAKSAFVGIALTPHLTTTLAVAFSLFESGLIDHQIVNAMIALSVVSTVFGTIAISSVGARIKVER